LGAKGGKSGVKFFLPSVEKANQAWSGSLLRPLRKAAGNRPFKGG